MKKLCPLGLAGLLMIIVISAFSGLATAQNVQDFTIKSFAADYYLDRGPQGQSTLKTVEQIEAVFPSYDQNHGILRAIPEVYDNHTTSLAIDSVTDAAGAPQPYTTYEQNDNLVLKIGDANTYVHGLKTYKITYEQKNVTGFFSDHDEFYWNVNGDQWSQSFGGVTAVVHVSRDLEASLQDKRVCFAGTNGSTSQNCQIQPAFDKNGGKVILVSAPGLSAGQTLTFAISFNKGTFKLGPEIAQAKKDKQKKYAAEAAAVIAPVLITAIYLFDRWRRFGRDPKGRGVIIPEYQPPKGLNALTSDYVFLEKLESKAVTALVIELAVRKYINIYEVVQKKRFQPDTTTYNLKLIKDPGDLSPEEQEVVGMFFPTRQVGEEAHLSGLANKLSTELKTLKLKLGQNLFAAGYFRSDPNNASLRYSSIGLAIFIVGVICLLFLKVVAIGLILSGILVLIISRYMPSRSQLGVQIHDHMLGLKDYIKLAEADRIKFLQSPQGAEKIREAGLNPDDPQFKVKLFESLLPYAMLFNLEKDWAKQFQNVYEQAPSWYSGNWNAFNTGYLVSSINNFSYASAATFSTPSSSGGSGFGGGFSGGGGGGGGGGGW
jgi:uncharacterized membrane protein YgcG